jgi:hypothetical protein
MTAAPARTIGWLSLAGLLVRLRWRTLWNGLWRVPRQRSLRLAWLLVALAPVAYVGLFATAFAVVAAAAPMDVQTAVLALAAGAITLASVATKMASSEAVVGGSGENEFLLARPVSLSDLVVGRSLAGPATDLFDALFLLPVLLAAGWVWRLGVRGAVVAAVTSVIVQVGVSAAAQAGQILVVRLVPRARRRLAWSALALLAALTMAVLWVVASWILRRPESLLVHLGPWSRALRLSPGALVVAPVAALAAARAAACLVGLGVLLASTAAMVLLARAAASWAGRAGWEQAAVPWAEGARGPAPGARMTLFTKDFHLVVRDRSRLVTLLALPAIFVGLQVFGSAGWDWTTGSARHVAVVAFSLAGYMATFGPLGHMEAERHAFWLLRVVPVPLGRVLAQKALFWSTVIGGTAALVGGGLLAIGRVPLTSMALGLLALAVLGAVTVTWLAVAMAAGAADLSSERRAVGPGTVYLFLAVEGLFNVVLLDSGELQLRGLLLFLAAVALHWISGVEQAAAVYDPDQRRGRRLRAGDGASLAILLFLGARGQRMALGDAGPEAWWGQLGWALVIASAAAATVVRRRMGPSSRRPLVPSLALGIALGATAALATGQLRLPALPGLAGPGMAATLPLAAGLVRAAAEELVARGMVQGALAARWPRARLAAAAASAVVALAAGARPVGAVALAAAVAPALTAMMTGRLAAAGATRLAIELATGG